MNNDIRDEIAKINCKVDHIMKVVCELYIITKSNEVHDNKLDKCIKSLNNLNYKIDNLNNNCNNNCNNIPIPPPLPTIKSLPLVVTNNNNQNNQNVLLPNTDLFLKELKKKLSTRLIQ